MDDPREEIRDQFKKNLRELENGSGLLKFELQDLYKGRAQEISDEILSEFKKLEPEFLSKNSDVSPDELRSAIRGVLGPTDDPAHFSRHRQAMTIFRSKIGPEYLRQLVDEYRKRRPR